MGHHEREHGESAYERASKSFKVGDFISKRNGGMFSTGERIASIRQITPGYPESIEASRVYIKGGSWVWPEDVQLVPTNSASANDETNPKDLLGTKKVPLRLVPAAAQGFIAKVFELGAKKYGAYNWREKKVRYSVYLEAAQRHILQAQDGEEIDPESGQPHAAHAAACMMIILDAKATGNLIDDRPTPGAASKVFAELMEVA